ncbi:MAG TPA: AI-2E family transporter [Micropepsaceae bacterium]|nr:AI-2E family transporter [Micropepsaceae bacterium]
MTIGSRDAANWLLASLALLALLIIGRPLLVPLAFTVLISAVLNAIVDMLHRFKLPRWLGWLATLALLAGVLYLVTRIVAGQAADFAAQAPTYVASLERVVTERLAPLRLGIAIQDIFSRSDIAGILTNVATSLGTSALGIIEVLIFVGFLLVEQDDLSAKVARLLATGGRHEETQGVLRTIVRQVQSYLGVCTILSAIMATGSYALLVVLGIQYAAFWSLLIFILTYIPTIGAVAVVIPALMALVQFGTLGTPLLIIVVLGALHFILMNIAATLILGQSLNLSPFAIILALTFWGLVWGIAGLFLAVPMTAAIAIICAHIDELRWVSLLLAAPPPRAGKKQAPIVP